MSPGIDMYCDVHKQNQGKKIPRNELEVVVGWEIRGLSEDVIF